MRNNYLFDVVESSERFPCPASLKYTTALQLTGSEVSGEN